MYDAIVIGAGPAGLQAALTLGRMHRSTLVLDSGDYRNGTVAHMHNMIANDGTPPSAFRATAHTEVGEYEDVEIRDIAAHTVSRSDDGFTVTLSDGSEVEGRRLVLATGIADDLPPVPGLQQVWGVRAFSCPFCDGHEHAGLPIAILGPAQNAQHLIGLLGRIVGRITVFPLDDGFSAQDAQMLEQLGVDASTQPVTEVVAGADGVRVITSDSETDVAGIFVAAATPRHRAPFADQLGVQLLPSGAIEIDDFGLTSVEGVYAAGDLAHRAALPGPLASVLLAAAAGQMAAIGIVRSLAAG